MRLLFAVIAMWICAGPATAAVEARIDIPSQSMTVYVDGQPAHFWRVSTGRQGYDTPRGAYRTQWMDWRHYSRKYDNAPMHYAVFFTGGVAVHATGDLGNLGRPASHGCVRLHPANARAFYSLVKQHGLANSQVVITD